MKRNASHFQRMQKKMKNKTEKEILEELFPPSGRCHQCDAEPADEDGYCSDSCKRAAESFNWVPPDRGGENEGRS